MVVVAIVVFAVVVDVVGQASSTTFWHLFGHLPLMLLPQWHNPQASHKCAVVQNNGFPPSAISLVQLE